MQKNVYKDCLTHVIPSLKTGQPILIELIDLVNFIMVILFCASQIVNLPPPTVLPFMDLLISYYPSICCVVMLPPF